MQKIAIFISLFLIFTINAVCSDLEITVINVGQGDAIFIKAPNNLKIMIDAGSATDANEICTRTSNAYFNICNVLNKNGVSSSDPLDYLFVTHYHSDHYNYVANVVQQFGLPKLGVIDRGGDSKWSGSSLSVIDEKYIAAVASKRNPNGVLSPGAKIDLGSGAYLQLLSIGYADNTGNGVKKVKLLGAADANIGSEFENAKSLVFVLRWNGFDMLLGGDCNEDVEESLGHVIKDNNILMDVYKVHHHGSQTSSLGSFLTILQPEVAICSTGDNGTYQHPRKESYDRLYNLNRSVIFQTNEGYSGPDSYIEPPSNYGYLAHGNVKVVTSGTKNFTVITSTQKFEYPTDD